MKTSGSLLSPNFSRWRRGHHCLSSEQGSRVSSQAQPPSNHRDSGGALTVMHSHPQITSTKEQMSDRASQWMGAYGQFFHCLGSYASNNSALCCSPKHVLYCLWYTLSQKHRKHVYMHFRWSLSIYTQSLYVCIFGQQVHGIVYSVYHMAI